MIKKIVAFFRGRTPQSVQWEEVSQEIMRIFDTMKVKVEITPYYYKVTSGGKTWYWRLEDGAFDGTSWAH